MVLLTIWGLYFTNPYRSMYLSSLLGKGALGIMPHTVGLLAHAGAVVGGSSSGKRKGDAE